MNSVVLALTVAVSLAFTAAGAAKLAATDDMRRRADHLGWSVRSYRVIGTLELAGAAGLLVGLALTGLAVAAAAALVMLMAGAVAVHLRSGDAVTAAVPAAVLGAATVVLLVLRVFVVDAA
ncbi:DoxX family protein [Nocardioides plantarum]|uniref:DoxX family protein n=1 Tax=Nocardioides plantarum TaxID=29299 RepID=A0ABV5KCD5_9ACTN|nr:DoxX family protein [Nocardioides plantarum]